MGLLDAIVGNMMGSGQSKSMLTSAMSMLQEHGGLSSVLDMFRRSGMASAADSWVGTGPNVGVSADQIQQVFGASSLAQLAASAGIPQGQAGSALAQLLPELINQLTP